MPPDVPSPDPENPNVAPAPFTIWTGTISAFLVLLEQVAIALGAIPNLPPWATVLVAATPSFVRFVRQLLGGAAVSFRRAP